MQNNQRQNVPSPGTEQGVFQAEVTFEQLLNSRVISLAYKDAIDPNHNLLVQIAPEFGSNMFTYRVGDYDLLYCDRELLKRREFTGNFVLWPFPNRIRDKRYTYNGHDYALPDIQRVPGDFALIHGLVFDRPWQFTQPLTTPEQAQVTTYIDITPDSPQFAGYPFESRLSLTYTLTSEGVSVTYLVENKGQQTLPYGFALHPYFVQLSGADDTTVSIPAEEVMEADEQLLPTGRVFDVNTIMYAPYDLRAPRPIGTLKLDHVYTRLHKDAYSVITYKKQQLQLVISATPDFTHEVIYVPGGTEPFFCLENQTCSTDAINLAARGLTDLAHLLEVQPGEHKSGTISYALTFSGGISN